MASTSPSRAHSELLELVTALSDPENCQGVDALVNVCADLAHRDAEDLCSIHVAGTSHSLDLHVEVATVLSEAASTCAALQRSGPDEVTAWLAARLGVTGAWVLLHDRLTSSPIQGPA